MATEAELFAAASRARKKVSDWALREPAQMERIEEAVRADTLSELACGDRIQMRAVLLLILGDLRMSRHQASKP